jgi:hypothetical protein
MALGRADPDFAPVLELFAEGIEGRERKVSKADPGISANSLI